MAQEGEDWACPACTFINHGGVVCEVCGTAGRGSSEREWACRSCTYLNRSGDGTVCEVCLKERLDDSHDLVGEYAAGVPGDDLKDVGDPESVEGVEINRKGGKDSVSEASGLDTGCRGGKGSAGGLGATSSKVLQHEGASRPEVRASPERVTSNVLLSRNSGSASFNNWLVSGESAGGLKRNFSTAVDSDVTLGDKKRAFIMASSQGNLASPTEAGARDEGSLSLGGAGNCGSEESGNTLLASLHAERKARQEKAGRSGGPSEALKEAKPTKGEAGHPSLTKARGDAVASSSNTNTLSILTYNVWFNESVELEQRMAAIGAIIERHMPDVICLQEVTSKIYNLLCKFEWWRHYQSSVSPEEAPKRQYFIMQLSRLPVKTWHREPFENSIMGRELAMVGLELSGHCPLVVAHAHLESPCPQPPTWSQMYSEERVAQAKTVMNTLRCMRNVVFCGDLNWNDKLDGPMPLPYGWCDAWEQLQPEEVGFTYDAKANDMLTGWLQQRVDRMLCHLDDFELEAIDMVGTEAIPGLTYEKVLKAKLPARTVTLRVLPSDHFGLLLRIRRRN